MATTNERRLAIQSAAFADLNNTQLGVMSGNDADLGFRAWGGKDGAGNVTRWLAKDKPIKVSAITDTSMNSAGLVKNTIAGLLTGGNTLAVSDLPSHAVTLDYIPASDGSSGWVDSNISYNDSTGVSNITAITTTTAKGYGEMYMYDNVTACPIDTINVYHAIYNTFGNNDVNLAPVIDTGYFTYKAGIGYAIAAFANYNSPTNTQTKVTITAGHALLAGEPITITGTTNYNGTYLVLAAGLTATEFVITKTYVADDATGSARRPATLKALVAGKYQAMFNFSGDCASANDVFKFELVKDITMLDNIASRGVWTTSATYRSVSSQGLISVTANQYIWAAVKNYSGTGDLTIRSGNVSLVRIL